MSIMSIESAEQEDTEDRNELMRSQTAIFDEYTKRIDYFNQSYQTSALKNDYTYNSPLVSELTSQDIYSRQVSWFYQLVLLIRRNFMNIIRLPQTSYVKVLVTIVTAAFTIILFQNCNGTLQGVQNRNGALFFITMTIAFNAI